MIELYEISKKQSDIITEFVQSGVSVPIMVTGSSMMPFLKPGSDIVRLEKCNDASFKAGNILLFRRQDGSPVLHRIRKVKKDGSLVMNGDSQVYCETVKPVDVLAYVTEIVHGNKTLCTDSFMFRAMYVLWYPTLYLRPVMKKVRKIFRRK